MYTSDAERAEFQAKFAEAVQAGDFSKIAVEITPYIKLRVMENSFAGAILRPRPVNPGDLIPEEGSNDTYFVYGQIDQPTQNAVAVNFRGQTPSWVPGGRRFKIPIGRHVTKTTRKSQDELMAFDYDLFQDLNEKDIFELHTLRDKKFLSACHAAVIRSGRVLEYGLSGTLSVVSPEKIHFTQAAQLIEAGTRTGKPTEDTLKATKHLMGSQVWHDLKLWDSEEAGSEHVSGVTINGYPATKILGINYLTSIKNSLFVVADPVAVFTFTGTGNDTGTATIDNVTATFATAPTGDEIALGASADEAAANLYTYFSANLGDNYVVSQPTSSTVRVRKKYDASWEDYNPDMTAAENLTNATVATGEDLWDHIFTYPDEDFVGEIISITGQDIQTDMWNERDEKITEVLRRATEMSGGAIGNINGVALTRLQRAKFSV